jgi:hypothetical protein
VKGFVFIAVTLATVTASAAPRGRVIKRVVAASTLAAENAVQVQLQVVAASTEAGPVDKGLESMQSALSKKARYQTLVRLSTQALAVEAKAQTISLPNGASCEVALASLEKGVATLKVKLAPTDTTYKLAKDKSLYLQAGLHEGKELWVVLGQPK